MTILRLVLPKQRNLKFHTHAISRLASGDFSEQEERDTPLHNVIVSREPPRPGSGPTGLT